MFTPMIVLLALLLALLLAGGTVVFFAARHAPAGFEDEDGFHFGIRRERAMTLDDARDGFWVAAYAPNRSGGDAAPRPRVRKRNDGAAIHRV
jgi:hypothetical protein